MGGCERNAEVAHAVGAGQQAGQDTGVRAIRDRAGCECFAKPDTLLCKEIQGGSLDSVVSVAADMVGAERVDRNKKDVRAGDLLIIGLAGNASARGKQAGEE